MVAIFRRGRGGRAAGVPIDPVATVRLNCWHTANVVQ